jgi:hypothetical protein
MAFIIISLQVTIKCHIWCRVLKNIPQNILFNLLCPQQWKILPTVFPNVNIQYMNTAGEMDHNNGHERRHTSVFNITTTLSGNSSICQLWNNRCALYIHKAHLPPDANTNFQNSTSYAFANFVLRIHKAHLPPDTNSNFKIPKVMHLSTMQLCTMHTQSPLPARCQSKF